MRTVANKSLLPPAPPPRASGCVQWSVLAFVCLAWLRLGFCCFGCASAVRTCGPALPPDLLWDARPRGMHVYPRVWVHNGLAQAPGVVPDLCATGDTEFRLFKTPRNCGPTAVGCRVTGSCSPPTAGGRRQTAHCWVFFWGGGGAVEHHSGQKIRSANASGVRQGAFCTVHPLHPRGARVVKGLVFESCSQYCSPSSFWHAQELSWSQSSAGYTSPDRQPLPCLDVVMPARSTPLPGFIQRLHDAGARLLSRCSLALACFVVPGPSKHAPSLTYPSYPSM